MNDSPSEPTLRDPEDNPWYLLATLHGIPKPHDRELQQRNKISWNRYNATRIGKNHRRILQLKFSELELEPYNNSEIHGILEYLKIRSNKENVSLPDISNEIDFRMYDFGSNTLFQGFIFANEVYFCESIFRSMSNFNDSVFLESADFWKTKFLYVGKFYRARFFDTVDFSGSCFSRIADFRKTYFFASSRFIKTSFSSDADFRMATFAADTSFRNSNFTEGAMFHQAAFAEIAIFNRAICSGNTHFREVVFKGGAEFINTELKAYTSFQQSTFCTIPPQFHGAKLHEGTVWRGVSWPPPPTTPEQAGTFTDAYERLKLEMDRLKKHEDELFFFAKEMECRRVAAGGIKGLPIAIYGHVCKYGQSYIDPLCWLLTLIALGSVVLTPTLGWDFPLALGVSAANTLGSLGFRKELVPPDILHSLPGWLQVFSGLQTLLGLILLFLTGLGLRNRFRMK